MADFATILAVSVSLTLVWTSGSLFDWSRARGPVLLRELFGCPLCLGVWIGGVLWVLFAGDPSLLDHLPRWAGKLGEAVGVGAVTGVVALTIRRVWDALDAAAGG